jgi:hypothetical protein
MPRENHPSFPVIHEKILPPRLNLYYDIAVMIVDDSCHGCEARIGFLDRGRLRDSAKVQKPFLQSQILGAPISST